MEIVSVGEWGNTEQPPTEFSPAKDHSFSFSITDMNFFKFIKSIQDRAHSLRFFVSPWGVEISECINDNRVSVYASMRAKVFGATYYCTGPVAVAFSPVNLNRFLKSQQQRDRVTFSFNHKKPNTMKIEIMSQGEEDHVFRFDMPLHLVNLERYDATAMQVKYFMKFDDQSTLKTFLSGVAGLDSTNRRIMIKASSEDVSFYHTNDIVKLRCTVSRKREIVPEDSTSMSRVSQEFKIDDFEQVLKCLVVTSGCIIMYMSPDRPLVFEVKIGTLGTLRIALLFLEPEPGPEEDSGSDEEMGFAERAIEMAMRAMKQQQ